MISVTGGIYTESDQTKRLVVPLEFLMTCINYLISMVLLIPFWKVYVAFIFSSTGTTSFKKPINYEVWAYSYLKFAKKADTFFPEEFGQAADAVLAELGMTRHDITCDSAMAIYLYLCELMQ